MNEIKRVMAKEAKESTAAKLGGLVCNKTAPTLKEVRQKKGICDKTVSTSR